MGKRKRVVKAKAPDKRQQSAFAWQQYLPIAAILLLTAVIYSQVKDFGFMLLDDPAYVSANGHVRGGLTPQGILWALAARDASNWHPLTWISHMLDCQLYGLNAGMHHITNLALHLANTLLLFIIPKRMTGAIWRSAFVAGLFAVHPLHVESVAWIAERKDVLSTFFWMLTMLAYTFYVEKPSVRRYLLAAIALALGLMAKPMLVSLPIVLLLLDYWPLKRAGQGLKRLVLEKTPLLLLSVGSSVITYIAQQGGAAVQELSVYPTTVRVANSLVSYAGYLAKMVLPIDLCPMYPHLGNAIPVSTVILSGLVLAALTATAVALVRKAPYLTVGWLFYVISLVPVIGLVQVGQQSMADRYTYIPMIGIFIAISWVVPEMLNARTRRGWAVALGITGTAIILILSVMTWRQIGTWRDADSFTRQVLKATHNHPLSRVLEGKFLTQAFRPVEAEAKLAELVREYPNMPEARSGLGCTLGALGRHTEAIIELKKAVKLRPNHPEAYCSLGLAYEGAGNPEEGLKWCRKAVELAPKVAVWRMGLAHVLAVSNRRDEAIAEYKRALRIQPDLATAERDLGTLLYEMNDKKGGIEHLQRSVKIDPDDPNSHFILGSMLLRERMHESAIEHFAAAAALRPDWAEAHGMLALALDGAGRREEARAALETARRLGANAAPPQAKP